MEMCARAHANKEPPTEALLYLQREVGGCVDTGDIDDFESLSSFLFPTTDGVDKNPANTDRVQLYERIAGMFKVEYRPPSKTLGDILLRL